MWNCAFDSCELINGLVLGALASTLSTIVVLAWQRRARRFEFERKFKYLEGAYDGFGFQDSDLTLRKDTIQSKALVTYLKENKLRIRVNHGDREWIGDMIMELATSGSIVWRYEPHNPLEFNFGLKRCIARKTDNEVHLLLIGEAMMDGTYKEQFDGKGDELIREVLKPNKEIFIMKVKDK